MTQLRYKDIIYIYDVLYYEEEMGYESRSGSMAALWLPRSTMAEGHTCCVVNGLWRGR